MVIHRRKNKAQHRTTTSVAEAVNQRRAALLALLCSSAKATVYACVEYRDRGPALASLMAIAHARAKIALEAVADDRMRCE